MSLSRLSLTPTLSQRERERNITSTKEWAAIKGMKIPGMTDEPKPQAHAQVFSLSLWERAGVRERGEGRNR
jgi:hypothetical protein